MPGPGGGAVTRPLGGVVFVVIEAAVQHCFPPIEQAGAACSQAMLQKACTFPFTWWWTRWRPSSPGAGCG
jgi:hypothetical protein